MQYQLIANVRKTVIMRHDMVTKTKLASLTLLSSLTVSKIKINEIITPSLQNAALTDQYTFRHITGDNLS